MTSKDGKVQSLAIRNLRMTDAGIYTCKIGDRRTQARLTVNESKPTLSLLVQVNDKQWRVKRRHDGNSCTAHYTNRDTAIKCPSLSEC